jgi:hypothetical protein
LEIDEADFAAEVDRGLHAAVGQLIQARAAPAGEDHGDGVVADFAGAARLSTTLFIAIS